MPGRDETARGEGQDDRRHEPLGEPRDGLAGARLEGSAACPHERPARALEQRERALELVGVELRARTLNHPQGV